MHRFFEKRATVVDVTEKEVIDTFQDGFYDDRLFQDFGCARPANITKLKEMITHWVDEEDKARNRFKHLYNNQNNNNNNNAGASNSGKQQQGNCTGNNYSSNPNRKRKPDNTVAAMETTAKPEDDPHWATLTKQKCPWHPDGDHTTEQCYQLRRALKNTPEPTHPNPRFRKHKGKKANTDKDTGFQNPSNTVNVIFGGIPTKRMQKLALREIMSIQPAALV